MIDTRTQRSLRASPTHTKPEPASSKPWLPASRRARLRYPSAVARPRAPPTRPALPRPQVEKELSEICASILQLLDDHLIPTASTGESKVFYLKMKGDYHRYLAEFKTGADRKEAAEHTLLAYKAAQVRGTHTRTWGRSGGGPAAVRRRGQRPVPPRGLTPQASLPTIYRRTLRWWTCRPRTPSAWAWRSTSPSSTTRS